MKHSLVFVLSLVVLLVLIPGIALSDVFAEKLLVASGKGEIEARFSFIDKITGNEIQFLGDESGAVLDGIAFSPDGILYGSSNADTESGIREISFLINDGVPTARTESPDVELASCSDMAYAPDGTLYCTVDTGSSIELHEIDLIGGTSDLRGDTMLPAIPTGLAVSPDDIIYLGNQNGLYTLHPQSGHATNIGSWNIPDNLFNACDVRAMDFDSLGTLYVTFDCDEADKLPYLALIDISTPEIISFTPITTDFVLPELFSGSMRTDAMTFLPIDFDFLIRGTYGTIESGFDDSLLVTASLGKVIITADNSEVRVCDNTLLTITTGDEVKLTCNNTTIEVLGNVETEFEADNGSIATATLKNGDSVTFDSKEFTITNDGGEDIHVLVNGDILLTIHPGETLSLGSVITDHYLGYPAKVQAKHNDDDDDDNDRHSKYKEYLKYFKENHPDTYKKYKKYLKYFDDDDDNDKSKKYFKYAKSYYDKYHGDDDDKHDGKHHDKHGKLQVTLTDEHQVNAKYDVKKLKILYNPVDKNDEGIVDDDSHLVGYDIKKSKGEPKFKKIKNILVTNQFGEITVDIKKAKMLLVPSSKAHDAEPLSLDPIEINHFKCYDAKVSKHTPKFEKRTVTLDDQFTELPITMEVKKPKMLCLPVEVETSSDVYETVNENSIMCYELKKSKGTPKFEKQNVFTNNHFGAEELEAKTPNRLCVPSTDGDTSIPPEPEPELPSATLEIIKTTNMVDDNFSITITNNDNSPSTYSLTFLSTVSGVSPVQTLDLIPGDNYTISEDNLPANFDLVDIVCTQNSIPIVGNGDDTVTFTPAIDDVIACTVVNNFTEPKIEIASLTIVKDSNQDGIFQFEIMSSDPNESTQTVIIDTLTSVTAGPFVLIAGNEYNVNEFPVPDGFTLMTDFCVINVTTVVDTIFTPVDGDVIVCTFENIFTPTPPTLEIIKNADYPDTFDFTVTNNDSSLNTLAKQITTSAATNTGTTGTFDLISGNEYTITEDLIPVNPGYTLTIFDCTDGTTSLGTTFRPVDDDVIVCTFFNSFASPE